MPEETRPEARIDAMLSQLSHSANLGISPQELLTRAIDGLLQVTQAPAGVACLVNSDGKALEMVSVRGIRPAAARTLPQVLRLDVGQGPIALTRPVRFGEEAVPGLEELHRRLSAEGVAGGILLPLSSEGRLLGLLVAMFRAGAAPIPALPDSVLLTMQREISTALGNARVRHGLQTLNTDLLRLLTMAKILGEPRELEETLTMVAQAAKSFSGAVATAVWLADPAERRLTRIVSLEPEGPGRFPRFQFAYGEGLPGWVAETGEALHLDEALPDARLAAKEWARGRGIRSAYAFPLRFKEALVGVLSVWTGAPLAPPQLSLLGIYSDHAALAIGHARLLRDKEAHAEQLSTLMTVAQTINEEKSTETKLGLISDACRRATGAPWLSVWRADGHARTLSLLYADPADRGTPDGRERVDYGAGLVGWTALHRQARTTDDLQAEPLAGNLEWYSAKGIRASVTLPLVVDNDLVGVLHLGTQAPLASEQHRLVEGYAALAAASLARSGTGRRP